MDKPFAEVEAGLEKSGRVEELIKLYDSRSREVPPPEGAPLLNKAAELARDRLKAHGRAEEFFRRSLLLRGDQREALLGLKILFEQKQDQAQLADTLERLGAQSQGPESATFYLRAAEIYEQKVGRRDRAIFCCQQACRMNPQDRASFRRVRALFMTEHKFLSAFDALQHERATFGDEGMAEEFVAFAERMIDDPTQHELVQRALGVAAELEPASPRVEKAQRALEKFEHTWRDRVRMLRGQSLEERDRKSAARLSLLVAKLFAWYDPQSAAKVKEALDRCFLLWPAMPDALSLIEKIAERAGFGFDATAGTFERMAIDAKDRTAQVDLWIRTGTLKLTKLDDKGGALDAFEKAVAIDPSRADASGLAAELLLEMGEAQEAVALLEKHLATMKDRATQIALRLRLADLCATLVRNVPAARVHLEAVLNLDGTNATAAYELARLYVQEGDAESLEPLVDLAVWAPRPVQDRVALCEAAGMLFEESNHPKLAFQVLARGLYLDPSRVDVLGSMLENGRKANAVPELTRALQLAASVAPPEPAAALWRSVAALAETPESRKQAWEEVVKRAPDDRAAAEALADAVAELPAALSPEPKTDPGSVAALPRITPPAPNETPKAPDLGPTMEMKLKSIPMARSPIPPSDRAKTEIGVPVFKGEDPKAKLEAEARRLEGSAADPASAAAIYRQILEIAPDDVSALKRLGAASAAMAQWEEVARVASRLGEITETLSERQEWRGRLAQLYAERLSRKDEAVQVYLSLLAEGAANAAVVGGLERLASAGVRQAEISRALAPHYAKTGDYQRQVASLLVQLTSAQETDQKKELLAILAQTHERHLADVRAAFEFRVRGLQADPADKDFLAEAVRLARELSSHTELSRVLSDLAQKSADAHLSSALLVEAATLAEEGGSVDDAAAALKLALDKSPDDPEVLAQLIQLYFKSGRFADCDQVLRRRILLAEGEEKANLYLKLADVSQELHRPREAAQALQEAIKAGAAEEPLLERLTELLEQGGRISELAAALQKQIELATGSGDQDKVSRLSLKRAQVLEAQLGDKGEALKNYSAILEQRPSDPDALAALEHLLGDPSCAEEAAKALIPAYEAVKEHRKLIHALETVSNASQDDLEKVLALKKAAYVHLHLLRQPELAFAALARAMRLAPGDAQVRNAARQAAEDADQLDAFAEVAVDALQGLKDTARVPLHRELAEVYEKKLAKRELAVEQLRAALELDGKNLDVLKALQRLHRAADDWAALADVLLKTAAVVPEPSEKVHLWREAAFLYEDKLSDQDAAAAAWRQIAERDPLDRESAAALDQLYTALDKPQELAFALELRRAQEGQSPQGRELAYRLAQVRQHKLSDSAGALQLYRQIVTEDPGHKGARAALEDWVVKKGPVSAAALEILDPVLVQLSDHQKRVQLREARMDGALPQEKARLAAEICAIYERDLGQAELAFMAALRAFSAGIDQEGLQPELERLARVTGSFEELCEVYENAAANLVPTDERALALQARAAELREQLGQPDEAVRLWRLVLEGAPQDRHALDSLGRLYEQNQNARQLSEVYARKANLSADPAERLDLLLKAGAAFEAAGDDEKAIEHFRTAIALKKTLEGLASLDRLYGKAHRTEEQADVLDQLAELASEPDEQRGYLSRRALLLEKEGGPGEALAAFTRVLELSPNDPTAVAGLERMLGNEAVKLEVARVLEPVYRSLQDTRKLVEILDLRLGNAVGERRLELLDEIARLREALGEKAQAFAARMQAFSEAPGSPELFAELDRLAAETGSFEDLAALYEEHLKGGAPEALQLELWRRVAAIYAERLNRLDLAARAWTEVARKDQADMRALENLGAIYRKTRAFKELAQIMKRQVGLEKNVATQIQLLFELARLAEETLSDKALAAQCYQAIMARKPDDQNAIKFLGRVLAETERWPELAALLQKEIALCEQKGQAEESCELMVRLGRLKLSRLGDPRGALDLYQAVLQKRPSHPGAVGALEEMAKSDSPLRGEAASILEPIFAGGGDYLKTVQMLESRYSAASTPAQRADLQRRIAGLYVEQMSNPAMAFLAATKALQELPDDEASLKLCLELAGPAEATDELDALLEEVAERATEEKARLNLRRALAVLRTSSGDEDRAIEAWKRVLELDPSQPQALDRLSELLSKVGNGPELAEVLRRKLALTEDPEERAQLMFEIGDLQYGALKDAHGALATFRLVLEQKADSIPVLERMEQLSAELERWPELADVVSRRIALSVARLEQQGHPDPQSHQEVLDLKFRLAQVRELKLLDKHGALQMYTEILAAAPRHPGALQRLEAISQREAGNAPVLDVLLHAYRQGGDAQKLGQALEARVNLAADPYDRKPLLRELAELRLQQQEPEMAFLALFRGFKDDPNDAELRAELEKVADSAGTHDELASAYEEELPRIAEAKDAALVCLKLGTLYEHRLKEAERAVGVYERARTFDPEVGLKALPALDRLYAQLEAWQELAQVLELEVAAAEQPADKVKLLFRLGQLHQDRLQSQDAAAAAYERILQIDKTHLASARLLEQIYEAQGQVDKLYVVLKLQRDAVQGPERDRILSRMAQVSAEGLSDIDHSIEIYQELLAKNPRNEQAFASLEGLLEKAGKHQELFELLKKKLASVLDPRELVRLNEKVGRVLFRMAGKAEEAIPYFKAALDRDARNKSALESMREIYDQLGRKDELVVVLRRLLPLQEQAEGVKAVRLRLAEVLAEMNRREEALDAARRALEVEPHQVAEMDRVQAIFSGLRAWADAARALELKADLHVQLEERDQAVATLFAVADLWRNAANKPENAGPPLEKILELDPANRSAYEQAIDLHAKHNDWRAYAQAVDRYLPHLVTDEEKVEALKDLARVQEQRLGQNDLAFMAACRALQLNPADDGIREEVERLAEESGSHDEIAAVYEELADELPRGPLAERIYLKLAQIQDEKLDDASAAEASLRKILDFDPTNQVALDRLAQMFARRGADTEYVVALEQKLETAGSIEERKAILREIARVYDERQQNPEEAASALLRALELEPDEETLRVLTELYRRQQRWPDVANTLLRARDLASTPEQRGLLQVQVAELYEREIGDDEAAIAAYAQALEFDPAQRGALDALERLYTKLDRPGDLLQTYNSQLELTADVRERVKIFFKSASIWEDKYQNLEHADTCIQNILEIDPANLQAITMLERLRRAQERWEDLVAVFDRHLQIAETAEEQAQLLVEAGEIFYHQLRQVDRAAQSYTRALEVEPTNRAAMHALGTLYERSGNWPFALEMLTREAEAFGAAGEAVELYYRMGKINEEMLLDMDSAKHSYERALQIDPGYLPAIRSLKGIYESAKDWTAYEQALIQEAEKTEDPEAKAKAYLEVARHTAETKEDKEGAAGYYEEALRLLPDLLEAARPLADIYIAREDWEKGERMLDIVVKEMPVRVSGQPDEQSLSKELCRQYYRLGYVVEKLAKKEKALACYEKAYQLDATYLPALEGLGNMLVQARRLEEALKVYQSILIHHRDDLTDLEVVEVYWQIGDIHYGLKQYDRAQNHFEKAMAIDPHHEPTLRALVQLADGAGKWDKAAEYRSQLVQVLDGEPKFSMYVELGMLAREKLKDPYMAIDAYGWAHKLSPEALDVMDALYQLYRETKQGAKAAEIVEKLLESPEMKSKPEKAKRIHYALGEIARDELKDLDRAVAAFNAALDTDFRFLEAFSAIEALLGSNKQWKKLEENYARMIQRLPKTEDTHAARMTLWRALGDLYLRVLKQPQDALMAYKVVAAGLPLDAPVQETYAELASQFPGNEDEAIGAYRRALLQSQNQGKVCSALAELAARKRDYDTAYLAAQVAQSLIGQAGDAEKEILTKLQPYAKRKEVAQRPVSEQQWQGQLFHPSVRGPLGQLLALVFNQAGHLWAVKLEQYQINPKRHRIDVASAPEYQIHHFRYVAKLLGMEHVELYSPFLIATRERMAKRSNEPAPDPTVGVEICHSHPMTLRVGGRFFGEAGQKEVYYLLGRTMALMRPELALATRLSPERLEAVLQAAITLVVPNFRLTAHPQAVGEERRNLEKALTEPIRAQLSRMVQQYLKVASPADLKNYLEGVELTGVRTGLFVAGEVEPAKKMVLNETGGASRLTSKSKLRDLAVFALSDELHALRAAVGTNVEVQVQARR